MYYVTLVFSGTKYGGSRPDVAFYVGSTKTPQKIASLHFVSPCIALASHLSSRIPEKGWRLALTVHEPLRVPSRYFGRYRVILLMCHAK